VPLYIKQRLQDVNYNICLADYHIPGVVYAHLVAQGSIIKKCTSLTVKLHHPEITVILLFKEKKLKRYQWTFDWERRRFKWSRNSMFSRDLTCHYLPSKYDQPIAVALLEHSVHSGHSSSPFSLTSSSPPHLTLLHYNIDRVELDDCRGLEVLMILSTCAFLDMWNDGGDVHEIQEEYEQKLQIQHDMEAAEKLKEQKEREQRFAKLKAEEEREMSRLRQLQMEWDNEVNSQRQREIEEETRMLQEQFAEEQRAAVQVEEQSRRSQQHRRSASMTSSPSTSFGSPTFAPQYPVVNGRW